MTESLSLSSRNSIFKYFFWGFFLALLSSQSMMDLFSGLLFFSGFYLIFKKKSVSFPKLGIEIFFIAWVLIILSGLLLHIHPENPWLKNWLEFRWILELYMYLTVLIYIQPQLEDFKPILGIALFAALFAVIVYFLGYDPIFESWSDRQKYMNSINDNGVIRQMSYFRTGGLLSNPMPFAHTYGALTGLFAGISLWLLRGRKPYAKAFAVCTLLLGISVLLSFTRGVWIGLTLSLLFATFVFRPKWALGFTALVAIGFFALYNFHTAFKERILFSLAPTATTYDSERVWVWKANLLMFQENPLLGVGYSENGRRLPEFYERLGYHPERPLISHAHNQYLHYLAGTGILGFALFLVIIGFFLKLSWKTYKKIPDQQSFDKGLALGCLTAQLCFLISGLTESNLSIAKNRYFMMFIWALSAYLAKKYQYLFAYNNVSLFSKKHTSK